MVSDYKHFGAMCILLGFSLGCIKHSQVLTWQCLLSLPPSTQLCSGTLRPLQLDGSRVVTRTMLWRRMLEPAKSFPFSNSFLRDSGQIQWACVSYGFVNYFSPSTLCVSCLMAIMFPRRQSLPAQQQIERGNHFCALSLS